MPPAAELNLKEKGLDPERIEPFLISCGRDTSNCRHPADVKVSVCLREVSTDLLELAVCSTTNGGDSSQTDNDDQSQHHCVLNCSRAIFGYNELLYTVCKLQHY